MINLAPGTFFGDVQRECEANHLIFSQSHYARGNHLPLHAHANPLFCLVLEGHSSETVAGASRTNIPSALIYHPAEEPHANMWHSDGQCFHIEVGAKRWGELLRDAPLLARPRVFCGEPIAALARRVHREFMNADAFSGLVLEGLVLHMLADAARMSIGEPRVPRWLLRVREMLHDSFDSSLSMSAIAQEAGVHPAHLSRTFRKFYKQTPGEYVRRIRTDAAAQLLTSSSFSIAEIASRAGFADQSHLTKCFLRERGVTPDAFRQATSAHNA